jgi:predicted PurR-regulated permease PerM
MKNGSPFTDTARTTLVILSIGVLAIATFWIVKPFLLAMVWASMYVVATWPLLIRMEKLLWGSRTLAAAAMTIILVLVFIVPLIVTLILIEENMDKIMSWLAIMDSFILPEPPVWLDSMPLIGHKLSSVWKEVAAVGASGFSSQVTLNAEKITTWFLGQAGNVGRTTFDFLVTIIIAGVLYSTGEIAASGVLKFSHRLAGDRGVEVVILAARTVRGVARGVIVTAVVQAAAGGIGLALAGVPAIMPLSVAIFILCLIQLGPLLVLLPVVIWLFYGGHTIGCVLLLLWALFVSAIENFLRPMLIRKSVDIPLFLVFPGVIGGLMALGITGVFIGPVVLAVTYSLVAAWIREDDDANKF